MNAKHSELSNPYVLIIYMCSLNAVQIHDSPYKASVYLYVNQRLLNTTVNKLNKLYMAICLSHGKLK